MHSSFCEIFFVVSTKHGSLPGELTARIGTWPAAPIGRLPVRQCHRPRAAARKLHASSDSTNAPYPKRTHVTRHDPDPDQERLRERRRSAPLLESQRDARFPPPSLARARRGSWLRARARVVGRGRVPRGACFPGLGVWPACPPASPSLGAVGRWPS